MIEMLYRAAPMGTVDSEKRTVSGILASENPVMEMDYRTWEVLPTVLLMSGAQIPKNSQVPLLDNHSRRDSSSVIGSVRNLRVAGDTLVGDFHFSRSEEVNDIWLKVEERHITDVSVGRVDVGEPIVVPEGQTAVVEGRTFVGPVRVVTKWKPKEGSTTPIGADELAKMRSEAQSTKIQQLEKPMADKKTGDTGVTPVAAPDPIRSEPVVDEGAIRAEGFKLATEITDLCERHGIAVEKRSAILSTPGVTIDSARAAVLDEIQARSEKTSPGFSPSGRIETGVDELDKFRTAAGVGLFIRAGLPLDGERGVSNAITSVGWKEDEARRAGHEFIGYSLKEVARECLRKAGQSIGGNPLKMVGRAMVASDLPTLMSNVANKSLFEGWNKAEETWEIWADGTGSVSDFKTNTIASVSEFDDLDQIVNDTGYKYGERIDKAETFQIATYGKLAAITRTVIINDDLGALVDTHMTMGESCSRKIGDLAYGVLTANSAMADGVALFHATHANLGTAAVVSEVTLAEAEKLAGLQKNIKSKQLLNVKLRYFVAPWTIKGAAEIFFNSNNFAVADTATTRTNPYGGDKYIRVYDARLDASSTTAYYFMSANKRRNVRLFFLNGNRTPYMEQKKGWDVDGVEYKVRIDAVAKAISSKEMVKNAGA